jgi:phosphatidylethanolamine/phosphatidyl-N-methylethanolamine N-methyltransferase
MDNNASLIDWTPELYSKLSKRYDLLAPIFFSMGERAKKRVTDELKSGSVLDVACGTGALLSVAFAKGLECYGTDNAKGMIAESRRKIPRGEFKLASFYDIPYPNDTFDTVLETNAVSGVVIDPQKVIAEMVRVCKPGGQILIGDYCKAPVETAWTRFMAWIGGLIGDQPHDFADIFRALGYEPHIEFLGWSGMYQFIQVIKE